MSVAVSVARPTLDDVSGPIHDRTATAPGVDAARAAEAGVLRRDAWRTRQAAHAERADAFTAGWRARRPAKTSHPIDDFLFTYYPTKPGRLRQWHPGVGVVLDDAAEWADRPGYVRVAPGDPADCAGGAGESGGRYTVDVARFLDEHARAIGWMEGIVRRTLERPARFGCFGLHEWAMVYRLAPDDVRHAQLPLRLGSSGTDAVVEAHDLTCTHIDAFRFFTPEAAPRNRVQPTRETQPALEQGGCLHANMDLYKWALRLGPLAPGELVLDAFELARDIRELDMRASPYDVSAYGLAAVPIETDAGKREYAHAQRGFAERADVLRTRILEVVDRARAIAGRHAQGTDTASI